MIGITQGGLNLNVIGSGYSYYGKFTNSGSDNMSVNGSVTPIEFTLEDLSTNDKFLLERVTFSIQSDEVVELDNFGNVSTLTNGIDFIANIDNIGQAQVNIKDNGDVLLVSTDTTIDSIKITGSEVGLIRGNWDFTKSFGGNAPIIVDNKLKIVINDDLTLVPFFKVSCHAILLD